MEEAKKNSSEELLNILNKLLEKMPVLIKRAEVLQSGCRELERLKALKKPQAAVSKPMPSAPAQAAKAASAPAAQAAPVAPVASAAPASAQAPAQAAKADSALPDPYYRALPPNIPEQRRRNIVFLYSEKSASLLERFLNDADSISLSGGENSFFLVRSALRLMKGSPSALLKAALSPNTSGFVCLGALSEEESQELSEICINSNIAFFHADEHSYTRNLLLDFLIELIAIWKVLP